MDAAEPSVVAAILACLDTPSLGRLGRVSQRFCHATRDPLLWIETTRISHTAKLGKWRSQAFTVYGRYVTTFTETRCTFSACKRLRRVLAQSARVRAPLASLVVNAELLEVVRRYSPRLVALRELTVYGSPTLGAMTTTVAAGSVPAFAFPRPVFARVHPGIAVPTAAISSDHDLVTHLSDHDWATGERSMFRTVPVVRVSYFKSPNYWYRAEYHHVTETIYTDNASWSLADAVDFTDRGANSSAFLTYRRATTPIRDVARYLMAVLGDRIRSRKYPLLAVTFPDGPASYIMFDTVLATFRDGSVDFVLTSPTRFVAVLNGESVPMS
jgi:hypothetical protein